MNNQLEFNQQVWDACVEKALRTATQEGDCICYRKNKSAAGYGRVFVMGERRPLHRVLMEAKVGRRLNPEELVLHSCDNPPCASIGHLRIGTLRDNALDMVARNRHPNLYGPNRPTKQPTPEQRPRGSRVHGAKMDDEKVRQLRSLRALGFPFRELTQIYGIKDATARKIAAGRTWRHVSCPI